jgi:hypothetical protein
MFLLKPVIAQVLGITTQHLVSHAQPMQTVGLALQAHIALLGNRLFVALIKRLSLVHQLLQIKLKVALQTIQDIKDTDRKQELVVMEQLRNSIGYSIQTPVF